MPRLRHRSPTNSRPHKDGTVVAAYRESNPFCEGHPSMCQRGPHDGEHIHHIAHQGVRCDRVGNIIHLCDEAHAWAHANPVDGTLLCLDRKLHKGELSLDDWNCGSVKRLPGWLEYVGPRVSTGPALSAWSRLVAWCEGE